MRIGLLTFLFALAPSIAFGQPARRGVVTHRDCQALRHHGKLPEAKTCFTGLLNSRSRV